MYSSHKSIHFVIHSLARKDSTEHDTKKIYISIAHKKHKSYQNRIKRFGWNSKG